MEPIIGFAMAFSDPAVETAIRQLSAERPGEYLTYAEIAERAGASERTVKRYMERIGCAKFVKVGGRRIGFQYTFVDETHRPIMGEGA